MQVIPYILLGLTLAGFVAVIIHWINIKRKGGKILEDSCKVSGKSLVKLYHLQKEREEKETRNH